MKAIILILILLFVAGCAMTQAQVDSLEKGIAQNAELISKLANLPVPAGLGIWEAVAGLAVSGLVAAGAIKVVDKKKKG